MTRKRFRREDWLDLGLEQLGRGGPEALKVHDLCAQAERTIGSFYHHFKDINMYITELGQHWHRTHTQDVIETVDALDDPDNQAKRLGAVASQLKTSVDLGVRRLAEQRQDISDLVAQVDAERVRYLQGIYARRFHIPETEAKTLAELEYAAFVGTQVIWRQGAKDIGLRLSKTLDELIQHRMADVRDVQSATNK